MRSLISLILLAVLLVTGCGRRKEAADPKDLVLIIDPVPETAAEELLRNPSFEEVPGKLSGEGILPSEWVVVSWSPDTYSSDESYGLAPSALGNFIGIAPHDGVRWVAGGVAGSIVERFGQVLSKALTPGKAYLLSGYFVQCRRADRTSPGTYEVSLAKDATLASNLVLGRIMPLIDNSNGWEYRELSFVAPAGAEDHRLLVFTPVEVTGACYPGVDSLSLRAQATQSDCQAVLRNLGSDQHVVKGQALMWLAQTPPLAACQDEVARALIAHIQKSAGDSKLARQAAQALASWATPEQARALQLLMASDDRAVKESAMLALGRLKHEAAAPALAQALTTDRPTASQALRKLGPPAETDVLDLLERVKEDVVVREACVVLTVIGTDKCLPALQKLSTDKDMEIARTASLAIAIIRARLKAAEKPQPKDGK